MNTAWKTVAVAKPSVTPWSVVRNLCAREVAEHKGMIVTTPLVLGAICAALMLLGVITASVWSGQPHDQTNTFTIEVARGVLTQLGSQYSYMGTILALVMPIMMFMYAVHSLYDERKTRSILFWKSLPVSDHQVVLSKLLTALVVIPGVYMAVFIALSALALVCLAVCAWNFTWNPLAEISFTALLAPFNVLLVWPVYTFWAFSSVAYLLFVSVVSRSKPLLVALLVPLGLIVVWSMVFAFIPNGMDTSPLIGGLLGNLAPFSWGAFTPTENFVAQAWSSLLSWHALASVVLGAVLFAGAVRQRAASDDKAV